jgi:hypothetical protein
MGELEATASARQTQATRGSAWSPDRREGLLHRARIGSIVFDGDHVSNSNCKIRDTRPVALSWPSLAAVRLPVAEANCNKPDGDSARAGKSKESVLNGGHCQRSPNSQVSLINNLPDLPPLTVSFPRNLYPSRCRVNISHNYVLEGNPNSWNAKQQLRQQILLRQKQQILLQEGKCKRGNARGEMQLQMQILKQMMQGKTIKQKHQT